MMLFQRNLGKVKAASQRVLVKRPEHQTASVSPIAEGMLGPLDLRFFQGTFFWGQNLFLEKCFGFYVDGKLPCSAFFCRDQRLDPRLHSTKETSNVFVPPVFVRHSEIPTAVLTVDRLCQVGRSSCCAELEPTLFEIPCFSFQRRRSQDVATSSAMVEIFREEN